MYKLQKVVRNNFFDIINIVLLLLITVIMLYPLYFTIIASVSEPADVVSGNVIFWIKGFNLEGYKNIFKEDSIWRGYRNSIIYTVLGTMFSVALTIPAAYALSKKKMGMRKQIMAYFMIPMFFNGGLLPTYITVKNLGLVNSPIVLIILGSLSVYNVVVARSYFDSSVPESLYEAAEIDGASQFRQFFMIGIPLAKPIIAVIALYYAVARWNDYFNALIYVSKSKFYPLQLVLRGILLQSQRAVERIENSSSKGAELEALIKQMYMAETIKYGIIFIASLPMLIAYPFVQKYFVKGVMIGSVKG